MKIPPHVKFVTTLTCAILMSVNKRQSETDVVINDTSQASVTYGELFISQQPL